MEPVFFETQADWRAWLAENHDQEGEFLVGFYKKGSGKRSITWPESVDEALCFGWIDGIRKSRDDESYTIRFTPRRRGSNWSAVNIARVGELTQLGLMHPAGLKAFDERDPRKTDQYSFEQARHQLNEQYEGTFRENAAAWGFFQAQPPYYRKTISWWVMSAKKEETRLKRLGMLIEASEKGERLGQIESPNRKN